MGGKNTNKKWTREKCLELIEAVEDQGFNKAAREFGYENTTSFTTNLRSYSKRFGLLDDYNKMMNTRRKDKYTKWTREKCLELIEAVKANGFNEVARNLGYTHKSSLRRGLRCASIKYELLSEYESLLNKHASSDETEGDRSYLESLSFVEYSIHEADENEGILGYCLNSKARIMIPIILFRSGTEVEMNPDKFVKVSGIIIKNTNRIPQVVRDGVDKIYAIVKEHLHAVSNPKDIDIIVGVFDENYNPCDVMCLIDAEKHRLSEYEYIVNGTLPAGTHNQLIRSMSK